ncbi:MAG: response regulator [Actinomycetales bacterium]|nr:response regulator [Actinomycetales bacterium]
MSGVRVMIAEDEALIRLDLAEQLTEAGYQVVAAVADGRAALAAAAEHSPDVVLVDIRMPGEDGLSVTRHLSGRGIAVVMVTAHSTPDVIAEASDAGALAYLVKPVSAADLLAAIEVARARRAELAGLAAEVARLTGALAARRTIDLAKAALQRTGLSEDEAFRLLRRQAMDARVTMGEVAQRVLDAAQGA